LAFNGSGTFLINSTGQPVVPNTTISSTVFNALTADLATGLSTCLTRDGQSTATANIPMGTFKFTGLGYGTGAGQALVYDQFARAYSGNASPSPFSTSSATYVMLGLGTTLWGLIPLSTGRIRLTATGTLTTTLTGSDSYILGKYGTGTAPNNGVAVTGTSATTSEVRVTNSGATGALSAFTYYAEITGLTVGTPYWFDLAQKVSGGGATTANALVISAQEF